MRTAETSRLLRGPGSNVEDNWLVKMARDKRSYVMFLGLLILCHGGAIGYIMGTASGVHGIPIYYINPTDIVADLQPQWLLLYILVPCIVRNLYGFFYFRREYENNLDIGFGFDPYFWINSVLSTPGIFAVLAFSVGITDLTSLISIAVIGSVIPVFEGIQIHSNKNIGNSSSSATTSTVDFTLEKSGKVKFLNQSNRDTGYFWISFLYFLGVWALILARYVDNYKSQLVPSPVTFVAVLLFVVLALAALLLFIHYKSITATTGNFTDLRFCAVLVDICFSTIVIFTSILFWSELKYGDGLPIQGSV